MNHQLWTAVGARVLAVTFVIAGVAACGDRLSDTSARAPKSNEASPSAVVVGQAPAEPTAAPGGDTAQTTSPAGAQSQVSKHADNTQRPIEGDNHSHSTLSPVTPQKSEGVNAADARSKP